MRQEERGGINHVGKNLISTNPWYREFTMNRMWRLSRVYGKFLQVSILSEYIFTNDVTQNIA